MLKRNLVTLLFAFISIIVFLNSVSLVWALSNEASLTVEQLEIISSGGFDASILLFNSNSNSNNLGDSRAFKVKVDNNEISDFTVNFDDEEDKSVCLAIDTSGSMRRRLKQACKTAKSFIKSLSSKSRISILSFNDSPVQEIDFSNDKVSLEKVIMSLHYGGRFTALYDTMHKGLNKLKMEQSSQRFLIVVTDGKDENSKTSLETCLNEAKENKIPVFIIALGYKVSRKPMRKIALESGGKYYQQRSIVAEELNDFYDDIKSRMQKQTKKVTIHSKSPIFSPKEHIVEITYKNKDIETSSKWVIQKKGTIASKNAVGSQKHHADKISSSYSEESEAKSTSRITSFGLFALLFFIIIFLIVILLLRIKHKKPKRICPVCGEEIPDYLEECINCSEMNDEHTLPGIPQKSKQTKALVDTEPIMLAIDEIPNLDKTIVLIDTPVLQQIEANEVVNTFDLSHIEKLYVGRDKTCDIIISDSSVSSKHALITKEEEYFFIEDLSSTNGTFCNERKVETDRVALTFGDTIRMGQSVMIFKLEQRRPR